MALLLAKKIGIPKKYTDFSDIFSKKSAAVFPDHLDINKHTINLEPGKQLLYKQIYSLGLVELETLKTYIEANLANRFIQPSKSSTRAPIFFV